MCVPPQCWDYRCVASPHLAKRRIKGCCPKANQINHGVNMYGLWPLHSETRQLGPQATHTSEVITHASSPGSAHRKNHVLWDLACVLTLGVFCCPCDQTLLNENRGALQIAHILSHTCSFKIWLHWRDSLLIHWKWSWVFFIKSTYLANCRLQCGDRFEDTNRRH